VCGIFGVLGRDTAMLPDVDALKTSLALLGHRGPDANGTHVGPGIGLAHTRLSLVDPGPRSDQPFWDETGRYALVYNGEIYNFRELRSELEARGVSFLTTSDTEVLLKALIHDPAETVLPSLDGMFAFGFYDTETRTLLVARDRFGMKPLYYAESDTFWAFTSEVKALRPWMDFEVDPYSIASYLLGFGGPSKGSTFYRHVRTLAPGAYVKLQGGSKATPRSFFTIPDFWNQDEMEALDRLQPGQMVDRLEQLMFESVERQMFADAPVGAFCSGGVDSSLLLAMAAKIHGNLSIFHANVVGPWSEVGAARQLSNALDLELNVVDVHEQDFVEKLPDVMRQYEHPYTYHPNCTPFMMVSRLVRENGVKGMLSGEGSDELFLGYPWLGRKRLVDAYYRAGRRLRSLIRRIPEIGPIAWPDEGNRANVVRDLLNRREVADDDAHTRLIAQNFDSKRLDSRQIASVDYMNYHLRTLLHRNDCLGMEASVEARFPFLDHAVARTALNMPARFKLRFSPRAMEKAHPFVRDKWAVREVANRWMPRALSQRTKLGFWTTVFQRMQVAPAYFDDSMARELFELSRAQMRAVCEEADQDLTMRLLHLDVWAHVCLADLPIESSRAKLLDNVTIRPESRLRS
jgi:asparagine synthase (glutamine-hydrolysing)